MMENMEGVALDMDVIAMKKTMVIMVAVMETVEDLGLGFGYY